MTRKVDLVSYLPPFLSKFKEIAVTLEAENPEFILIWNAAQRVLQNQFIETADEYGIARFENILKILPSKEDTLESRRARIQARWFHITPYTLKSLIAKLIALCEDSNFTIIKQYQNYRIEILTNLQLFGQVEELEHIISGMLPCNMIVSSMNRILCDSIGFAFIAGGVCSMEHFFITNDNKEDITIDGSVLYGGGVLNCVSVMITNDFNEQLHINGENIVGSGVVTTEFVGVKQ